MSDIPLGHFAQGFMQALAGYNQGQQQARQQQQEQQAQDFTQQMAMLMQAAQAGQGQRQAEFDAGERNRQLAQQSLSLYDKNSDEFKRAAATALAPATTAPTPDYGNVNQLLQTNQYAQRHGLGRIQFPNAPAPVAPTAPAIPIPTAPKAGTQVQLPEGFSGQVPQNYNFPLKEDDAAVDARQNTFKNYINTYQERLSSLNVPPEEKKRDFRIVQALQAAMARNLDPDQVVQNLKLSSQFLGTLPEGINATVPIEPAEQPPAVNPKDAQQTGQQVLAAQKNLTTALNNPLLSGVERENARLALSQLQGLKLSTPEGMASAQHALTQSSFVITGLPKEADVQKGFDNDLASYEAGRRALAVSGPEGAADTLPQLLDSEDHLRDVGKTIKRFVPGYLAQHRADIEAIRQAAAKGDKQAADDIAYRVWQGVAAGKPLKQLNSDLDGYVKLMQAIPPDRQAVVGPAYVRAHGLQSIIPDGMTLPPRNAEELYNKAWDETVKQGPNVDPATANLMVNRLRFLAGQAGHAADIPAGWVPKLSADAKQKLALDIREKKISLQGERQAITSARNALEATRLETEKQQLKATNRWSPYDNAVLGDLGKVADAADKKYEERRQEFIKKEAADRKAADEYNAKNSFKPGQAGYRQPPTTDWMRWTPEKYEQDKAAGLPNTSADQANLYALHKKALVAHDRKDGYLLNSLKSPQTTQRDPKVEAKRQAFIRKSMALPDPPTAEELNTLTKQFFGY